MQEQKLDLNMTEEVAQGIYSNLAVITHSDNEFILDFVAMLPGLQKSNVRSRVIMTPQNAKRLLAALSDNIRKFEETHGTISGTTAARLPMGDGGLA